MLTKIWASGFILSMFLLSACGGSNGGQNQPAANSEVGSTQGAAPLAENQSGVGTASTGSSATSGSSASSANGVSPVTDPSPATSATSNTSNPAPSTAPPVTSTPVLPVVAKEPPPTTGTVGGTTDHGGTPATPPADWRLVGGAINPGGKARSVSISTVGGAPFVAWEEGDKIYTAAWSGANWQVEGPLNENPADPASLPTLAVDSGSLYLAWTEARSVFIKRREGGKWTTVAIQGAVTDDCAPANADLTVRKGIPTMAFDAFCNSSQYAGTLIEEWKGSWSDPQGIGTRSHYADIPSPRKYALSDGTNGLYLALLEGGRMDEQELHLYHQEAGAWTPVGGAINDSTFQAPFASVFFHGAPHVIFAEDKIRVKHWDGKAWTATGSSFPTTGEAPVLAINGSLLYAGFGGSDFKVWQWDGSHWTKKGTPLNNGSGLSWSVGLSGADQNLYAAWIEAKGTTVDGERQGSIFVKGMATP